MSLPIDLPIGLRTELQLLKTKASIKELAPLISHVPVKLLRQWCAHLSISVDGNCRHRISYTTPLLAHFLAKYHEYSILDSVSLRTLVHSLSRSTGSPIKRQGLVYALLLSVYPEAFLRKVIYVRLLNRNAALRNKDAISVNEKTSAQVATDQLLIDSWPQPIDSSIALQCCRAYVEATAITPPKPCVCCGRSFLASALSIPFSFSFDTQNIPPCHPLLNLLPSSTMVYPLYPPLSDVCPILDCLLIHHRYVSIDSLARQISLAFCSECLTHVTSGKTPKFSLCNNLYRGQLPDYLSDITWIEEKVCALHRVSADVARLQNAETDEKLPYRLVGNTCAYPVNVPSTARVLPRIPADIIENLTVVFVGAKFDKKKLPPMFRVRRHTIQRFLNYLASHNPLYANVPISIDNLNLYPEDDVLPLLQESMILNDSVSPSIVLNEETASFEQHPTRGSHNDPQESSSPHHTCEDVNTDAIIETTGTIDFNGSSLSGHSATATALYNLLHPRRPNDQPDLIIPHGVAFVNDYDNPALFPGMFPTLFPLGIGGLEENRTTRISFQEHANYLLSLHDVAFKHHRLFLFVALSIIKKRKSHLHTAFTVRKKTFPAMAEVLSTISEETLLSTAQHLQAERPINELSVQQKTALTCLQQLNIVSAKLPGSPASKLHDRSAIRGYFGLFGLPHIYLTMNPSAAHCPLLQVFFGDVMVDLSKQFPSMPLSDVRAKRIAKDPVAAADFFIFCIKAFFKFLLGFDPDTGISTGGILGHIKCYYGKCECTMRGCLHGHFVIWLLGGLNPREVHERLEHDEDFKRRFFEFYEQIIKHDAPYEDLVIPPTLEPRMQRPPTLDDPNWDSVFAYDTKVCAEKLQRHNCQEVCWKYTNVKHIPRELRRCRFQFPHEIVEESHYDAKSKSIIMEAHDPTMNYFNPHILVFCRHNHDIKSILSGKAAKAAMFYITNYITKDDLHSHHILSMMSATITHMNEDESATHVDRAKARLQRWASGLARLQEVHAQMAVMYLRGVGDTFASHPTVPMLSSILVMQLRTLYPEPSSTESHPADSDPQDDDTFDENEAEHQLRRSSRGDLFTDATQVDDYIFRDAELSAMSFYEFVCCVRKVTGRLTPTMRLGSYRRYSLRPEHPQSGTHILMQHQDPALPLHKWTSPPRVIGMQVPTTGAKNHPLFMLGHFKPFSYSNPLIVSGSSSFETLQQYQFSDYATTIMRNWADVHECEDQRDAERMKRKQQVSQDSLVVNARLSALANGSGFPDDDDDSAPLVLQTGTTVAGAAKDLSMVYDLRNAGWFVSAENQKAEHGIGPVPHIPRPSLADIRGWKAMVKAQELNIRRQRMNSTNSQSQLEYISTVETSAPAATTGISLAALERMNHRRKTGSPSDLPDTVATTNITMETAEHIIQRIGNEMTLNDQQWIAYLIVARKFVADVAAAAAKQPTSPPLRLLLTGPGGAGKSHVVKSLSKLMAEYGMSHKLRLLAPTGSAASLIDATTIHKGLGIKVMKRKDPKNVNADNRVAVVSKKKQLELEEEWRPTDWIFCDECSLLGAPLNAELHLMLRLVKDVDDWYGGANMVFAGDFSQYPPVQSTPLYEPIGPYSGSKTNTDYMKRLGRLAWLSVNSVVELDEQKRMASDPEYGQAVARLRMRRCTPDDVLLFNSRVVKSQHGLAGVQLSPMESELATTIVRDNRTRLLLNRMKANVVVTKEALVSCAARDYTKEGVQLDGEAQKTHLELDNTSILSSGGLPAFIPLAVGMKVVHRTRNISAELKVANGSSGIIIALFTSHNGPFVSADGAVVHFPASPLLLPGLPAGCIYLEPESKPYSLFIDGTKVTFLRRQMLIEPAYAVTGHFSQGKTLPVVVADLRKGGPAAYVAASRPTCRDGLFLLGAITLRDLTHPPLHPHLLKQQERFEVMKHNTLVRNNFIQGQIMPVPNEGDEGVVIENAEKVEWENPKPSSAKRKRVDSETVLEKESALSSPPRKRRIGDDNSVLSRESRVIEGVNPNLLTISAYPLPSLVWDGANYSCAYDSVLTVLYAIWSTMDLPSRVRFGDVSRSLQRIAGTFSLVNRASDISKTLVLHRARQDLRTRLSIEHPQLFPIRGRHLVCLDELFKAIGLDERYRCSASMNRCSCGQVSEVDPKTIFLSFMFYTGSIGCLPAPMPVEVHIQDWMEAQLRAGLGPDRHCVNCDRLIRPDFFRCNAPPSSPLLVVHSNPSTFTRLLPSITLRLPDTIPGQLCSYQLSAATYSGHAHFTARMKFEGFWYDYDGMRTPPTRLPPCIDLEKALSRLGDSEATHYIYTLQHTL